MSIVVVAAVAAIAEVAIDVGLVIYRSLHDKPPLPPLRDLQYMAATNGAPIPFGYGSCRVAGNVLWTPGIKYGQITKTTGEQGINLGPKGSYVFTASVAVSFGEGPGTIVRIWADTKLIYDSDPAATSDIPVSDFPAWSATQLYNPGNQVNYLGQVWQALAISTNSAPSQTNSNWDIISTYPPYANNTEYLAGDIVSYNGLLYVCQVANNNGNVGAITPDSGDTASINSEDVLYWILLTSLYGNVAQVGRANPTIYPGDQAQLPDPTIQAAEGATLTPAYRGQVYFMWEDFPLTNFGDRIPSFRAQVLYTKTSNLLYGSTPTPAQGGGGALQSASSDTGIVEFPNDNGAGNTVIVTIGADPLPPPINRIDALADPALDVIDSQGNAYTGVGYVGAVGTDGATVAMFYCNSVKPGPNTVQGLWPFNFSGAVTVYEFPGSWTLDQVLKLRANLGTETSETIHTTSPGELAICAGHGHNMSPTTFTSGTGTNGIAGDTGTAVSLTMRWEPAMDAETSFLQSAGVSGIMALFKPPASVIGGNTPGGGKPDVIHDICERSGLVDSQISNSLLVPPNIQPTTQVQGYLVDRPAPAATVLKVLMLAYFFDACESGGAMTFVPRGMPLALTIPEADLGLVEDKAKLIEQISQEQDLPRQFTITYNDPTLDFQQNKQLKGRNVRIVKTKNQTILEVPMTMTADWAKQMAEKALYLAWLERNSYKMNLWRAAYLLLDPTDVIAFVYETLTFQMRVQENSIGQGLAIALSGVSEYAQLLNSSAVGGQAMGMLPNPVILAGPTVYWLFDIPLLQDVDSNPENTGFYLAMSSVLPSWSGGVLYESDDDSTFAPESSANQPATFGYVTVLPGAPRSPWTWDNVNTLTVALQRGSFQSDSQLNVLNGSNALLVGSELIQFTTAVQNGDGTWTLSGLLRGRRGTEWAIGGHTVGELVLMPATGIVRVQRPLAERNITRFYKGVTVGQDPSTAPVTNFAIVGRDLMPYAPAQITSSRDGSNNLTVNWIRRTRVGWANIVQDPVPLAEDTEAYSIDVLNGSTVVRTLTSTSPTVAYSAAQQTTDFGSVQAEVAVKIYQLSVQVGRGFAAAATV